MAYFKLCEKYGIFLKKKNEKKNQKNNDIIISYNQNPYPYVKKHLTNTATISALINVYVSRDKYIFELYICNLISIIFIPIVKGTLSLISKCMSTSVSAPSQKRAIDNIALRACDAHPYCTRGYLNNLRSICVYVQLTKKKYFTIFY